jgi:hypothetical protein
MDEKHVYELRSINLANLPPEEAEAVLDKFRTFLNSLSEPITFYIIEDKRSVYLGIDEGYLIPYKRFFIESPVPIDEIVEELGARFVKVPSVPRANIVAINPRSLVTDNSELIRVYNISSLFGVLQIGFLSMIYGKSSEIRIEITPMDIAEGKAAAHKRSMSVGSKILMRTAQGRSIDPEDQVMYQRMVVTADAIAAGREKLFKVKLIVVVKAADGEKLAEAAKQLRNSVSGTIGTMDSPKYLQWPLYMNKGPKWATGRSFMMPTSSLMTFFPFAGLDVIDPDGIMLGQNMNTGNALIYDIFDKENYNLAIAGQTGYGKSVFLKTFFSRLALQYPDNLMIYVFDSIVKPEYAVGPDGTYEHSFARMIGATVHRYSMTEGAGLDPFVVFRRGESMDSPPDTRKAADFLASLARIDEDQDLLADLYIASENATSVDELIQKSPERLQRRLQAALKPFMFLFEGKFDVDDKMVFVLNDIPNAQIRDAAAFLTLAAIWQVIKTQPVSKKKAIVIDEGWSLVETNPRTGKPYFPMAVEYVPEIARTGRHYNTCFAIATQLVSDFIGRENTVGPGREMMESCATKIILHQDQAAAQALQNAFRVSEIDKKRILNFKIGEALLMSPDGRVQFYNLLSDTEKSLFTTRPKEVKN